MSWFSKMPPEPQICPAPTLSATVMIVIGLLTALLVGIICALNINPETLTLNTLLWQLLIFPLCCALLAVTLKWAGYVIETFLDTIVRNVYQFNREQWHQYASASLRLADYASLFPIEEAALKMCALEGEMPSAKDIPCKLAIAPDEENGLTRLQQALVQLLDSLDLKLIDERRDQPGLYLYLRNADGGACDEAVALLQSRYPQLAQSKVYLAETLPGKAQQEYWLESNISGFRLLVILELHSEEDCAFCEYGVALLFSRQRALPDNRLPVWCFSSVESTPRMLIQRLKILFASGQLSAPELKHVWTGKMRGESLRQLKAAMKEHPTSVEDKQWHSMTLADSWTPGYQWLALAWAAEAIRNGERGQLVVMEDPQTQQLTLSFMNSVCPVYQIQDFPDEKTVKIVWRLISLVLIFPLHIMLLAVVAHQAWKPWVMPFWLFISLLLTMLLVLLIIAIGQHFLTRNHQQIISEYYRTDD